MGRLEFVRSRAKNVGMLLLAGLFVAGGVLMAVTGEDAGERMIGWLAAAFFSLAVLAALRNIVRGGTVFSFDSVGITDRGNSIVIPWNEIDECVVISVRGSRFLGLTLRNPDQFLNRLSAAKQKLARLNERMGWGHWGLSFAGISPGLDEALSFIRRHAPSVRTPPA